MWGVIALTVATFTVLLAVRRFLVAGSEFVFTRYVAVGGLVAFSTDRDGDVYFVRFEVGGPGVFHNVAVQLLGVKESAEGVELERPAVRHTMAAGDDPIEWTFHLSGEAAERAWVMVTWVRPYLQGVESEIKQHGDREQTTREHYIGTDEQPAVPSRKPLLQTAISHASGTNK